MFDIQRFTRFNLAVEQLVKVHRESRAFMPDIRCLELAKFAQEFQTIKFDPGRKTGKKTWIKHVVDSDDLIVVLDEQVQRVADFPANVPVVIAGRLRLIYSDFAHKKNIYIYLASFMSDQMIDDIYRFFSDPSNPNQLFFQVG